MTEATTFEVITPPRCPIGEAEARAIIESSQLAGTLPVGEFEITLRESTLVPPGRVYILNAAGLDWQDDRCR